MTEPNYEEAPLLGGLPSPSQTMTPPISPAPVHTPSTLQVPPSTKVPKSQTSMDSGCESDAGDGEASHLVDGRTFVDPHHNSVDSTNTHLTTVHELPTDTSTTSEFFQYPTSASSSSNNIGGKSNPCDINNHCNDESSSPNNLYETHCSSNHLTNSNNPNSSSSSSSTNYCHHRPSIYAQFSPADTGISSEMSSPGTSCSGTSKMADQDAMFPSNNQDIPSIWCHTRSHTDPDCSFSEDKNSLMPPIDNISAIRSSQESIKVTFGIEGDEGEDDCSFDTRFLAPRLPLDVTPLPRIPSYTKSSFLSSSSSTASMPICRICHLPEGEGAETLISPCRCAGTMEFIHHCCLMKWLEVSGSRSRQVPSCELCNYPFHRRKKFRLRECQMPTCSRMDKILHIIFLICLVVMFACAAITVVCFKQDSNPSVKTADTELTYSEVVTLTCGVLFFVAFFLAMYVEVKATDTLYRLCTSFFYINQITQIYDYDKKKDSLYSAAHNGGNAPV